MLYCINPEKQITKKPPLKFLQQRPVTQTAN